MSKEMTEHEVYRLIRELKYEVEEAIADAEAETSPELRQLKAERLLLCSRQFAEVAALLEREETKQ